MFKKKDNIYTISHFTYAKDQKDLQEPMRKIRNTGLLPEESAANKRKQKFFLEKKKKQSIETIKSYA